MSQRDENKAREWCAMERPLCLLLDCKVSYEYLRKHFRLRTLDKGITVQHGMGQSRFILPGKIISLVKSKMLSEFLIEAYLLKLNR